jgi:virginiamycin B lyase
MRSPLVVSAALLFLAGCSMSSLDSSANGSGSSLTAPNRVQPRIVQQHRLGKRWVQLTGVCGSQGCTGIAVGTDGNVWAADPSNNLVYQATMSGVITPFNLPLAFHPSQLASGTDGDLYVVGNGAKYIVRMTTAGAVVKLPIPSGDRTLDSGIVTGSAAVWFVEAGHIGKVTPDGTVTEFAYPSGTMTNNGAGITVGPNGRIWFVDQEAQTLGVVDQHTNAIVELPSGTMSSCAPYDIQSAAHFLWVGCGSATPELAKVTTMAKITYYSIAFRVGQTPQSMVVGPNGDPWMVSLSPNALSDFNPQTNSVTTYPPPFPVNPSGALALAPDGNFWMAGNGQMDVFLFNILTVKPNNVTLSGPGATTTVDVKEPGMTAWTATSSDPSIATIAQGATNSQFVITAVATGSCIMTIADAIGNSALVSVVVQMR